MWLAPTLVCAFGDPFIDGTIFERTTVAALSWSFDIVRLAMQVLQ
jgi:hypothetical protein